MNRISIASPQQHLLLASFFLLFLLHEQQHGAVVNAETCDGCSFTRSRAAHYPNSHESGTETGACGFGSFGATLNGGDVSAASELYRGGVGCGACYQVRCLDPKYCSDAGVNVTITDQGSSDRTDFILSQRAYVKLGITPELGSQMLSLGAIDIEFRRIPCSYPYKNITFKIDESSNFPGYLAFVIWFQQGAKDIIAVQLCEAPNLRCQLLERSRGVVWATAPPRGVPLKIRMLLSGGEDGDETWVQAANNIPQDWKAGAVYDSGIQLKI